MCPVTYLFNFILSLCSSNSTFKYMLRFSTSISLTITSLTFTQFQTFQLLLVNQHSNVRPIFNYLFYPILPQLSNCQHFQVHFHPSFYSLLLPIPTFSQCLAFMLHGVRHSTNFHLHGWSIFKQLSIVVNFQLILIQYSPNYHLYSQLLVSTVNARLIFKHNFPMLCEKLAEIWLKA